jgi:hypothetical protein
MGTLRNLASCLPAVSNIKYASKSKGKRRNSPPVKVQDHESNGKLQEAQSAAAEARNSQLLSEHKPPQKEVIPQSHAKHYQSPGAKTRLDEWESKRKQKLEQNVAKRRLSGEKEHGDWARTRPTMAKVPIQRTAGLHLYLALRPP